MSEESTQYTWQITEYPKSKLLNNYDSFISNVGKIRTRLRRGGGVKESWKTDVWQDVNHILSALIMGNMDKYVDVEYLDRFLHEDKMLVNPGGDEFRYEDIDGGPVRYFEALMNLRKQLDSDVKRLDVVNIYPTDNSDRPDIEERLR